MDHMIFDDYGIVILERFGEYFIRIDSGEIASRPIEAEISSEDALVAQKGPQSAYDVIIKYDKIGAFKNI